LKNRFGKSIDENKENTAADDLDRFLNVLKENADKSGIPPEFIDKLKEDGKLMAFYISCLAYGKYRLEDVYLDIGHTFKESTK
jgi:hypothetical protein